MTLYQKFRNSSLDTSPLGLVSGAAVSNSVYTPSGARVLAWIGDTSAHFCQVEGFGSMVFAVDPSAPPGDCIHPVARDLPSFIGLLVACRHSTLICQAYRWSRTYFDLRREAIRPDLKTRSVIRALENTYHPPGIDDPYGHIQDIRTGFDHTTLPLQPDYFEWCPIRPGTLQWNVGFGTPFSDYCDRKKAGQELPVQRAFLWHGESWTVPAIYLCENGIVVDSYLEVPGETMARFREKWGDKDPSLLSIEEQMRRKLDHPLDVEATGSLFVNGKPTPLKKSFTLQWDPAADDPWNVRRTMDHYGLDRDKGYLLRRDCFLRKGKNPPIRTMDLRLDAAPVAVPGVRFIAPRPGESMGFTDPSTGRIHTLTVTAQTREALDPNFLSNHPCCYTRLSFSLEPPIGKELFSIVDCDPGDTPQNSPEAAAVTVLAGKVPSAGHFAVSSLRHSPAGSITWRMVFRQKLRQEVTVPLLP